MLETLRAWVSYAHCASRCPFLFQPVSAVFSYLCMSFSDSVTAQMSGDSSVRAIQRIAVIHYSDNATLMLSASNIKRFARL